ncbi:uncharacterized protein UTRI_00164_B [Ustilago trichophora]|uniref:Uncharacterized protein n=1 Tax=Ustilago trichophora TaxID=86804 RepID=A0A5C3DP62_9BASI|nr:uncharacterized protein UTRI_00164_B [Ustilago trichophora]
MRFQNKSLSSSLVAMVALSIGVSASLDLVGQQLLARDGGNPNPGTAAAGKLAPAVNLATVPANPQAVLKLTGQDLHTKVPSTNNVFEASALLASGGGQGSAAPAAPAGGMSFTIDTDESGTTTAAEVDSAQGVVLKATSGLYTHTDPDKGSCAKTLAKHGEPCADRPYVVPQSVIPGTSSNSATTPGGGTNSQHGPVTKRNPAFHAGPYVLKRDGEDVPLPLSDWKGADRTNNLLFKRERDPLSFRDIPHGTDNTNGGDRYEGNGPTGPLCIDTVKRDKEVTKVVPTKEEIQTLTPGEPLNFELVKSDDHANTWNQIIYDKAGKPIDVTHLHISDKMSVWRAEYYCPECKPGHKFHKVKYENIEIETDEEHEHADPTLAVQCEGPAKSTNVHKKKKSRYQTKDQDQGAVKFSGTIFSIDQVTLGQVDKYGNGAIASVGVGKGDDFKGGYTVSPKKPGDPITKREVVEDNGPIF